MNHVEATLGRLLAAPVRSLEVAEVRTDELLQPRERLLVPYLKRGGVEDRSTTHTGAMKLALEASGQVELDPILCAEVEGRTLVCDGHHRLRAYRSAHRETIPARVLPMTMKEAVLVTKIANCSARSLELHQEQYREAGWQYVHAITQGGSISLEAAGESERRIAAKFRVGRETVRHWMEHARTLDRTRFGPEHLDPGTGVPHWRRVRERSNGWQAMAEKLNLEQWQEWKAQKLAEKFAKQFAAADPCTLARALQILLEDRRLDRTNPDAWELLRETQGEIDGDLRATQANPGELF